MPEMSQMELEANNKSEINLQENFLCDYQHVLFVEFMSEDFFVFSFHGIYLAIYRREKERKFKIAFEDIMVKCDGYNFFFFLLSIKLSFCLNESEIKECLIVYNVFSILCILLFRICFYKRCFLSNNIFFVLNFHSSLLKNKCSGEKVLFLTKSKNEIYKNIFEN